MATKQWIALALFFAFTLFMVGCGPSRPETAAVEGTVTYQGKPVEGARVTFYPPNNRPAGGTTDVEGKFSLMTFSQDDGVILGECSVAISKQTGAPPSAAHPMGVVTHFLPPKYANPKTSGLIETVQSGSNSFEFNLTD